MRRDATARADELHYGYAENAIDEGVERTEEAVELGLMREAQIWLSAIFVLVRRARAAR